MAKEKKVIQEPDRDELASLIAESLNKMNKDSDQIAFFLDGREDTPTDFTDFISTGATMLDVAISNRPHGGIAVGRITELSGLPGTGKSLVSAHLIANTQRRGGVGVLIDTETAVNPEFFKAVGIDINRLVYVHLQTVEEIFDAIVNIIEKVRTGKDKNKLVTIVVDSVSAASTKQEMESDFGKDGYATSKAIIISKAMRKITGMLGRERIALIFTNQLRQKMNAQPFSDQYTSSGGLSIPFHSSTRIRLSQLKKLSNGNGDVIGVKVKANVIKNRLGPPHRTADFDIYFNRGIDDFGSWLDVMKEYKLIKQAGAWYTYTDSSTNEEIKFQSKDFPAFLEEHAERKEVIYNKICDSLIMKYQSEFDPEAINIMEASDDA
jgi:recombination protein RecA